VRWGLNSVAGATASKTLSVHIANQAVAEAVQYAVDHGPAWLINWLGGADAIRQKIIARLTLEESASVARGDTSLVSGAAPTAPVAMPAAA